MPVEITVVRPDQGRLLVQTNRSAYVALFEIVPGRGVALLYPTSARQRSVVLSGLNWLSAWWMLRTPSEERRYSAVNGTTERYVYAVAADRPLRITDDASDPNYLRRVLGPNAYASNPNTVVRALQRQFIPTMLNEEWSEDLYAVAPSYGREPYRIARVYCPDGSVFEVREDMANRAWCPPTTRRRVPGYPPPREEAAPVATVPDSVLSPTGTRVTRRPLDPRQSTPPYRVPVEAPPTPVHEPVQPVQPTPPPTLGPPAPPPPPKTQPSPADPRGEKEKDQADNGRRAHGNPENADPRGRGNGRGNGGGILPPPKTEVTQQGKPRTEQPDSADRREKGKPDKPEDKADKNDKSDKNDKVQPAAEPKGNPQAEAKKKMDEMLRKAGVKPKADSSTPPKP